VSKKYEIPSNEDFLAFLESPEYKRAVAERMAQMQREYSVVEEAPWFGRTGLEDDLERELPRYLRREFGESIFDEDSLKAKDLQYVGHFNEPDASVHYWLIPSRSGEKSYAYIEITSDGQFCTSWGSRKPPGES
jgi:hypothetical protein